MGRFHAILKVLVVKVSAKKARVVATEEAQRYLI